MAHTHLLLNVQLTNGIMTSDRNASVVKIHYRFLCS